MPAYLTSPLKYLNFAECDAPKNIARIIGRTPKKKTENRKKEERYTESLVGIVAVRWIPTSHPNINFPEERKHRKAPQRKKPRCFALIYISMLCVVHVA